MIAVAIIAVLIVIYVLLASKEAPREYEVYNTAESIADRYHKNRVCYLNYK